MSVVISSVSRNISSYSSYELGVTGLSIYIVRSFRGLLTLWARSEKPIASFLILLYYPKWLYFLCLPYRIFLTYTPPKGDYIMVHVYGSMASSLFSDKMLFLLSSVPDGLFGCESNLLSLST